MNSLKENFLNAHIVIIGSGIIGKFNALELSELGFQITILDPTELQNSSNAALGLLMGNIIKKEGVEAGISGNKALNYGHNGLLSYKNLIMN